MAHTATNWTTGMVITAALLNNTEAQYSQIVTDFALVAPTGSGQGLGTGNSPTFAGLTVNGSSLTSAATYLAAMNQSVATGASPSFAGLTVNGTSITSLLSYLSSINQALSTTSSPSFAALNLGGNPIIATSPSQAVSPAAGLTIFPDRIARSKSFYLEEDFLGSALPSYNGLAWTSGVANGGTVTFAPGGQGVINLNVTATSGSYAYLLLNNPTQYLTSCGQNFELEMFMKWGAANGQTILFGICDITSGGTSMPVWPNNGVYWVYSEAVWSIQTANGGVLSGSPTIAPSANAFHVMRLTRNGNVINAYVDGVLVAGNWGGTFPSGKLLGIFIAIMGSETASELQVDYFRFTEDRGNT